MEQVRNCGDERNQGWCVHCGGPGETRDHVPSRVFLDKPYPEQLPVSPACNRCNNSFSMDEEYLACLLECVLAGDADPARMARPKIADILRHSPRLAAQLQAAKQIQDGQTLFTIEHDRVRNVLLKLARGHAAYEVNEPQLEEPQTITWRPLPLMTEAERDAFENDSSTDFSIWPEVGSRAMHRMFVLDDAAFREGWLVVQEGRYRYCTSQDGGLRVRIVMREYLACEVIWD